MAENGLDFDELRIYRNRARGWLQKHVSTLSVYRTAQPGYVHRFDETEAGGAGSAKKDPSRASTATCVESLIARGEALNDSAGEPRQLLQWLTEGVDGGSAGLPGKNAFTTAFMLDAALQVSAFSGIDFDASQSTLKEAAVERLNKILLHDREDGPLQKKYGGASGKSLTSRAEKGSANIEPYPPTAYLTQLVVRTLRRANSLEEIAKDAVRKWTRACMEHEIALLVSDDEISDPYALAYGAITFAGLVDESRLTPQEKRLLSVSIDRVFETQHADGSWPRSRPLFHYQKVGNAYCFEYEMLTQLLGCDALRDDVERHIPGLIRAINHLDQTRYDLVLADGEKGAAWASGHHPQIRGPESWSTASVYHFLHLMERFLSRLLRKELFIRLKADPRPLSATPVPIADFAKSMLDSEIEIADGKTSSLKDAIRDRFLKPLVENRKLVQNGKPFKTAGAKIEMSMLMFGPPGTSKTTLAEDIAKVMGWPLLKVDPSHILIEGWDRVHAAAIRLLDDLAELDEVVVLLDEFDELVRTRGKEHDDPISRFFTTAMLPKLIKLNEERRIVLLMATNYVDKFDAAITREGRFDKVVQVMPPSAVAKVQKWRAINLHFEIQNHDKLKDLSFSESLRLAKDLEGVSDKGEAIGILERHHGKCTLSKSEGEKGMTWKELCAKQKDRIRI